MSLIAYEEWNPSPRSLAIVQLAAEICADYKRQGYDLTLRQLYYQFVARDLLPNTSRSYDSLGATINRARLAGYLDWDYIVDRTRNLAKRSHWQNPGGVISSAADGYGRNLWAGQDTVVEVWVEKEALAGVVGRAATEFDCAYFSCRGYVSQSEMHEAALRMRRRKARQGPDTIILHLGDHDPSGIDMTRDIADRLALFGAPVTVERIALTMDQIELYTPPPNPAKATDARFKSYRDEYGEESWELDALPPTVLHELVTSEIRAIVDAELYDEKLTEQEDERSLLRAASDQWDQLVEHIETEEDGA